MSWEITRKPQRSRRRCFSLLIDPLESFAARRVFPHGCIASRSTKVPIHAAALVLIGVFAVYLFQTDPAYEQLQPGTEPAFRAPDKEEQAGPAEKFAAVKRQEEIARREPGLKELQSRPSHAPFASSPRDSEAAAIDQNRRSSPREVEPETFAGEEARVGAAAPHAKQSTTEEFAGLPHGQIASGRSQPTPATPDLRDEVKIVDASFIVRRARASSAQRRGDLAAADKSPKGEFAPPHEPPERSASLLPPIPERGEAQDVWLTIPRAQLDELRRELLAIGSIEAESRLAAREEADAIGSRDRLHIKVTVLPATVESGSPVAPSKR